MRGGPVGAPALSVAPPHPLIDRRHAALPRAPARARGAVRAAAPLRRRVRRPTHHPHPLPLVRRRPPLRLSRAVPGQRQRQARRHLAAVPVRPVRRHPERHPRRAHARPSRAPRPAGRRLRQRRRGGAPRRQGRAPAPARRRHHRVRRRVDDRRRGGAGALELRARARRAAAGPPRHRPRRPARHRSPGRARDGHRRRLLNPIRRPPALAHGHRPPATPAARRTGAGRRARGRS